jgi:hypothetical protein
MRNASERSGGAGRLMSTAMSTNEASTTSQTSDTVGTGTAIVMAMSVGATRAVEEARPEVAFAVPEAVVHQMPIMALTTRLG